jgi:hypothetical protein
MGPLKAITASRKCACGALLFRSILVVPVSADSVEQIKSDDARRMLRHANQQLELQKQYAGRFTKITGA